MPKPVHWIDWKPASSISFALTGSNAPGITSSSGARISCLSRVVLRIALVIGVSVGGSGCQ